MIFNIGVNLWFTGGKEESPPKEDVLQQTETVFFAFPAYLSDPMQIV